MRRASPCRGTTSFTFRRKVPSLPWYPRSQIPKIDNLPYDMIDYKGTLRYWMGCILYRGTECKLRCTLWSEVVLNVLSETEDCDLMFLVDLIWSKALRKLQLITNMLIQLCPGRRALPWWFSNCELHRRTVLQKMPGMFAKDARRWDVLRSEKHRTVLRPRLCWESQLQSSTNGLHYGMVGYSR